MLNKTTKQRIDRCRDLLVGQLPLPSDQINMITLALVYKLMDDMDRELLENFGSREFFTDDLGHFSWDKIRNNSLTEGNTAAYQVNTFFNGIQALKNAETIPSFFREVFSSANIPSVQDTRVFDQFLTEVEKFNYAHSEELGNAFEYLLMTMGTQAKNGQFRTPRHIIDFIVEAVDPDKKDTFLDPACGTAGFLIAAYKYILWKYTSEAEKEALMEISGEIERTIEKKTKKGEQPEKQTVYSKIYSSVTQIYLENPKKEQTDEILPEGTYPIRKAEIVYRKQILRIENGQMTWKNGVWVLENFEVVGRKYFSKIDLSLYANLKSLALRPIRYGDLLETTDREHFNQENTFVGYDNTPLMVRLANVNMYLHDFRTPQILNYDTLSSKARWRDHFSCIFANPPFMTPKGGVQVHESFSLESSKAEILFSDYITSHLRLGGKAGFIVPEGIIFTNNTEYVALRRKLIYEAGLWAVVSLPAGVFNPYSGVKTSILLIDKELAKKKDTVLLIKVENDGYSLNTNRNDIETNDLPHILEILRAYKNDSLETGQGTLTNSPLLKGGQGGSKYLLLERNELASLDPYKAATTVWETLRKEYREIEKIKNAEKQAETVAEWLKNTGFQAFPTDEINLKTHYEETLKAQAIEYGANRHAALAAPYRNAIEQAREYNLSYDKYAFANQESKVSTWEKVKLGEIAEFQYGYTETAKDEGDVRFIRITDIDNFGQLKTEGKKFINLNSENEAFLLKKGDLLVVRTGATFGKVLYFDSEEPSIYASYLIRLKLNTNVILPKYYWYLSRSINYDNQKSSLVTGGGQPQFNANVMRDIEIPLPPLEVQEKIVREIEGYQKVIDGARQVIENYQATFEIKEAWERVKLGEVCELRTGSTPLTSKPEYYGGDIKWLVSGDIHKEEIFDCEGRITEEGFKNSNTKILPKNSVLIALNGQGKTRGTVALLRVEATCSQSLVAMTPSIDKITCEFLFYQLKQKYQDIRNLTGDNERSGLNISILKSFDLFLPPLSEQLAIVEKLEAERQAVEGCKLLISNYETRIRTVIEKVFL